ncbi:MAG: hypothetical protein KDD53_04905 [Bdellovibrionales bacterium]|nr:hypothetical protein [Bdellovibrionales bacterium]
MSAEIKAELKGPYAVIAIAIAALLALGGYVSRDVTIQDQGRRAIERYIAQEYQRDALPGLEQALNSDSDREELEEITQDFLGLDRVIIGELSVRTHRYRDENYVAKVEVRSIDGEEVPKADSIQYLEMEYSNITGWRVVRESTSAAYWRWWDWIIR